MKKRDFLIKAQKDLCKKKSLPYFMSGDGYCWNCKNDMVNDSWENEHQTGCPKCSKSYCD